MTETGPVSAPPAAPNLERWVRTHRLLKWLRDYESDSARRYYAQIGIWSSRIYAVLIFIAVVIASQLSKNSSTSTMLWYDFVWTLVVGRAYLWYQAKEILAFDVIEEKHATSDLLNSILPLISIGVLVGGWILLNFFYWEGWATFGIRYSQFGWLVILSSTLDVAYDLRINTRVTFILSKVPGRVEFSSAQPH